MGRRKKQVVVEEEIKQETPTEETKKEEIETKTKSSFKYTGTIKASIKKGDKVYFTKTYKNAGRWPLFKFFDYCLRGEYTQADYYRPKYVDLFYLDNAGIIPVINDSDNNTPASSRVSPYHTLYDFYNNHFMSRISLVSYPYLTTPAVSEKDNRTDAGIGFHSVTYKFNIPFTQISSTEQGINTICLYSNYNKNEYGDPSCFFFIEDPDHPGHFGNLIKDLVKDGMNISDFSLFLEWELSVGNTTNE